MAKDLIPHIIFEDTHLVVLSKPAGLLSQGDISAGHNLVDWLRGYFGRNYVGLVHRLDRNTSGLMVVAKRSKAADRLSESLKSGALIRRYQAWLLGNLKGEHTWEHFLLKNEETNIMSVVSSSNSQAKRAKLTVKAASQTTFMGTTITLAEFELETGRSHQIRVQSAASGFPLLGDSKYYRLAKLNFNPPEFHRPALHSFYMEFPHPMTKEILKFQDELPEDLKFEK